MERERVMEEKTVVKKVYVEGMSNSMSFIGDN